MTKSEYQELVEFLGGKFEQVDGRFAVMGRRFDKVETDIAELRKETREGFERQDRRLATLERHFEGQR